MFKTDSFFCTCFSYVWSETSHVTAAEDVILGLMHFIFDLVQKWLWEKILYYPLLHFIVYFVRAGWLWEQIFYYIFLFSIDFERSDCGGRFFKLFDCVL